MAAPDRRPRFRAAVYRSRSLSDRDRVFLLLLSELPAQQQDGRAYQGSRAMDAQGVVRLHRAYLADRLGCSEQTIRRCLRVCCKEGFLGLVRHGTHGYPGTYQALIPDRP
ncbi:hypothetical protein [Nocardioides ungokensis]|uniref:hypothetical protein n=1 Tax=Nocardioides ungokensis TaxID=1643322 RepID=UPI0015DE65AD|nr:hypothetical protein [Nocardioides ungokensis]